MSPRMTFTAGNDALAGEVNTYLMDQAVMTFAGTSARDTAIPSPNEGMLIYLNDVNQYQGNHGTSTWYPIAGQMPYYETAKNITQNILTGTETKVTLTASTVNRGGFTISSDIITVPNTGIYDINAAVYWAANATGYRFIRIYINGVMLSNEMITPVTSNSFVNRATFTKYLTAGDTIEFRVLQNSGATIALQTDLSRVTVRYVCP